MRTFLGGLTLCLLLAGCGSSGDGGSKYDDAAQVAKTANVGGCHPDSMIGATDTVSCINDSIIVSWFKSASLVKSYRQLADSAGGGDSILFGSDWAIECVHRDDCLEIKKVTGGDLD